MCRKPLTPARCEPNSKLWSVPCGAGALSVLSGHTVESWQRRILNFRKRNKRHNTEFTNFYPKRGKYWTDDKTLYFTEAMYFLKRYKARKPVVCRKKKMLRSRIKDGTFSKDKSYVIWYSHPDHIAIIHKGEFWDNDMDRVDPTSPHNFWARQKVTYYVEITPKAQQY